MATTLGDPDDDYEQKLARIDAEIAHIKARDAAAARERRNIAARIQAAQFQRDLLAHAHAQARADAEGSRRRPPRRVYLMGDFVQHRTVSVAAGKEAAARNPSWPGRLVGLLQVIAMVLPVDSRDRYFEEWHGEFYDLRAEGASWWRCVGYVAGIMFGAVPALTVTLRRGDRRAVD
jgi:hypothetical protein